MWVVECDGGLVVFGCVDYFDYLIVEVEGDDFVWLVWFEVEERLDVVDFDWYDGGLGLVGELCVGGDVVVVFVCVGYYEFVVFVGVLFESCVDEFVDCCL